MHRSDFEEFCGRWSKSELEEFDENTYDSHFTKIASLRLWDEVEK